MYRYDSFSIRNLYHTSCYEELKVNKPGNLSINSPILGMSYKRFLNAAKISGEIILHKKYDINQAIYNAVKKCMTQLGSNYNLGIILLAVPILRSVSKKYNSQKIIKANLNTQLELIFRNKNNLILKAIKIAKPGGIEKYDGEGNILKEIKNFEVKKVLVKSSNNDRISRAYTNSYSEIFDYGLVFFKKSKKKFSFEFSVQRLFVYYMSIDFDSHILRKFGKFTALKLRNKAKILLKKLDSENSLNNKLLINFDKYLKHMHLNPGTCADLTVTTLLIDKILCIVQYSNLKKV